MGGEESKWHQLAHTQIMSPQGPHFSPHSTAKTYYKSQISGKLVSSGISDVVFTSVYSEKTPLKKLMFDYEYITRNNFFWRAPEIDFCYETEAKKLIIDFKFDALYRSS